MGRPVERRRAGDGQEQVPGVIRLSSVTRLGTALLLSVAVVLSALLVVKHFGGGLPGCGPEGGCKSLESSPWGMVPLVRWPVSFLGFAYFLSLLAAWMTAGREIPAAMRWPLRFGGIASLVFLGVMLAYRKFCLYCAGVHAANLLVVGIVELRFRRPGNETSGADRSLIRSGGYRLAVAAGCFVAVSLVLGFADVRLLRQRRKEAEGERRASTERIVAQSQAPAPEHRVEPTVLPKEGRSAGTSRLANAGSRVAVDREGTSPGTEPERPAGFDRRADAQQGAGFTGRYRLGPKSCPIRVVLFTDYQCPDCKRIEEEMDGVLATRKDVSLSVKQFPMCREAAPGVPCNPTVTATLHANACWAARAAEAAGILKGNDGFWAMHRWLFARRGVFTDEELKAALSEMGMDPQAFVATMTGSETLARVQTDCREGAARGLFYTPMIFVNGVEFRGWQVPGALRRTVEEVAATNPPPRTAEYDRPVGADEKDIDDWRAQPIRNVAADTRAWSMGASRGQGDTRVTEVVLFGDYQEPYTASMDRAIREFVNGHPGIRYTFRHYPIDPAINPTLPKKVRSEAIHPLAGRAARAAEAAGSIGGDSGFWKMHAWLMDHAGALNDETLRAAAAPLGFDPARLLSEMEAPQVAAAVEADCRAGQQLGLRAVPMVLVDGRWVQRTMRQGKNVALLIIEAARKP
jgi:protein-disulfide isomerase/uncharacterized membrane protein